MSGGLRGARVLVTRAADDQAKLSALLRERGAEPLPLPCLAFAGPGDPAPLQAFLDRLAAGAKPAALAIASPQAARRLAQALRERGLGPAALAGVKLGATGEGTARELEAVGLPGALVPARGAGAEALAAALGPSVRGARVALLRAEEGNAELPRLLAEAGAEVESIALYRTVPAGPADLAALDAAARASLSALRAGAVDAVLFGSGSAARGFAGMLGAEGPALLQRPLVACMGARCAAECGALGLPVGAVADGGFPELLDRVDAALRVRAAAPGERS